MWVIPNREYPAGRHKVTIVEEDQILKRFWWCEPTDGRKCRIRYHQSALEPLE